MCFYCRAIFIVTHLRLLVHEAIFNLPEVLLPLKRFLYTEDNEKGQGWVSCLRIPSYGFACEKWAPQLCCNLDCISHIGMASDGHEFSYESSDGHYYLVRRPPIITRGKNIHTNYGKSHHQQKCIHGHNKAKQKTHTHIRRTINRALGFSLFDYHYHFSKSSLGWTSRLIVITQVPTIDHKCK